MTWSGVEGGPLEGTSLILGSYTLASIDGCQVSWESEQAELYRTADIFKNFSPDLQEIFFSFPTHLQESARSLILQLDEFS